MPYNKAAKILQGTCRQKKKKYFPVHSMCLSRVFVDLANTNKQHCLTIDCSGKNKSDPGRYRTQTNQSRDDELCK